ncbi:MAG: hypothetical protein D6679_04505 [Candidatus Hydrogenedentota bacterium]|nr:MAG: hypothetical protein D6679_04505 [Candidatus Hydrogenedentota bacterium]
MVEERGTSLETDIPRERGDSAPLLEVSSSGRIRHMCAVKGAFAGDFTEVRGAFIAIFDMDREMVERVFVAVVGDSTDLRMRVDQGWKELEDAIVSAKLSGLTANQMTSDVQKYLRQMLRDDFGTEVIEGIKTDHEADVRRILMEILSRAIADSRVLLQIDVERFEQVEGEEEDRGEEREGDEAKDTDAVPGAEAVKPMDRLLTIKVDPILAPVTGTPAKDLSPGTTILVYPRETSTVRKNAMKLLAARQGRKEGEALEGRVLSVTPAEFDRVTIRMSMGESLQGLANISGELRVKTAEATVSQGFLWSDEPAVGGGITTKHFVLAALAILLIMAVMAYFVFGGEF